MSTTNKKVGILFAILMMHEIQFDPTKHQMPRIDVFGWNLNIKKKPGDDGSNILSQNTRIPDWWSRPGMTDEQKQTRTKLAEQRHAERIPHISYDLDGDGFVGGKDYVVAKIFDKDGDGKLDESERKLAFEALRNVSFNYIFIIYCRPKDYKELFNLRHSSPRNAIERIFGVIKKRYPILTSPTLYPFETQVKILKALTLLHNFIRCTGKDEIDIQYNQNL